MLLARGLPRRRQRRAPDLPVSDLYLHSLGRREVSVYFAWRERDPFVADAVALAQLGYTKPYDAAAAAQRAQAEAALDPWEGEFCWIGSASWLSAGLFGEDDRYIPRAVARINALYAEAPVLTPGLLAETMVAFSQGGDCCYGTIRPRRLKHWLGAQLGTRLYPMNH